VCVCVCVCGVCVCVCVCVSVYTDRSEHNVKRVSGLSSRALVQELCAVERDLGTQTLVVPLHTSAYVSISEHTSEYVSIRQHTWRASTCGKEQVSLSEYVSIRQHTAAHLARQHVRAVKEYVSLFELPAFSKEARKNDARLYDARRDLWLLLTPAYVSIRQHTSADLPYVSQHTSAHVSTRQHTSAYVSMPAFSKGAHKNDA
jgi:hypothetical protein